VNPIGNVQKAKNKPVKEAQSFQENIKRKI
jgi:hypothetical protein